MVTLKKVPLGQLKGLAPGTGGCAVCCTKVRNAGCAWGAGFGRGAGTGRVAAVHGCGRSHMRSQERLLSAACASGDSRVPLHRSASADSEVQPAG